MTQINLIVNSLPRDLSEFAFFLIVGFTAGSIGLIWSDIEIPKQTKSSKNLKFNFTI